MELAMNLNMLLCEPTRLLAGSSAKLIYAC